MELITKLVKLKDRRLRNVIFSIAIFLILVLFGFLAYVCIYKALLPILEWGYELHGGSFQKVMGSIGKVLVCIFSSIFLIVIPFMPFLALTNEIANVVMGVVDAADKSFTQKMADLEKRQRQYEEDIKQNDSDGLIRLVNYSKTEMEKYYEMGLKQAKRSYNCSLTAMWLGFAIILFGLLSSAIKLPGGETNKNQVQLLTVCSGIVVEAISALFLWIYKSSLNQLTYFYGKQVFLHNALIAYKISDTMEDKDKPKNLIVQKIFEFCMQFKPDAIELPKTAGKKTTLSSKKKLSTNHAPQSDI